MEMEVTAVGMVRPSNVSTIDCGMPDIEMDTVLSTTIVTVFNIQTAFVFFALFLFLFACGLSKLFVARCWNVIVV